MKPKTIGLVGGAGPLAGAYLLERVLSLSMKNYGCSKDGDFPKIMLLSFPFSEMLSNETEPTILKIELERCLNQLRDNGASILAIACNTLHAFLDPDVDNNDLIHLPKTVERALSSSLNPLVLCTTTSLKFGLHRTFFTCRYPDLTTQSKIDQLIEEILKVGDSEEIKEKLERLIQSQEASTIILGCTELSMYSRRLELKNKHIIDPIELVSLKILERSFS